MKNLICIFIPILEVEGFFKRDGKKRYDTNDTYPCLGVINFFSNTVGRRSMIQIIRWKISLKHDGKKEYDTINTVDGFSRNRWEEGVW